MTASTRRFVVESAGSRSLVKIKLTSGSTVLMPDQQCRRGHAHRNPSKASWLRRTPLYRRQRSATPIAQITRNDA